MTVYSELPAICELIKRKTESFESSNSNPRGDNTNHLLERILSSSPLTELITASGSLDAEEAELFKLAQQQILVSPLPFPSPSTYQRGVASEHKHSWRS